MSVRYRKTRRLLRAGGHVFRAALLLFSLAAFFFLWMWTGHTDLVSKIEKSAFGSYEKRYQAEYQRALELFNASRLDESRQALEGMLSRMGTVRKQDRLASTYPAVAQLLLQISERQGRHEDSVRLSKSLLDLDANNYIFWLEHARYLEKAGRTGEAIEAFGAAFRIAPHSGRAASALSDALYRYGRKTEAEEALKDYLGSNRMVNIMFQYGAPGDLEPRTAYYPAVALTGKDQAFRVPASGSGVARVIALLGNFEDLSVRLVSMTMVTDSGRKAIDAPELSTNGLEQTGEGSYAASGGSPALIMDLPEDIDWEGAAALEIRLAFAPNLPQGLSSLSTAQFTD